MDRLTRPMLQSLRKAASREHGNVCPMTAMKGGGNSEMLVLHALRRRGLIDGMDENGHGCPVINDAGRAAIKAADCDCQAPDAEVAGVSEYCPVHNDLSASDLETKRWHEAGDQP